MKYKCDNCGLDLDEHDGGMAEQKNLEVGDRNGK